MREKIENFPWTPLLLFALLVSTWANWVELRHVQRKIDEWGWDNHHVQSEMNTTLGAMNDRLTEISGSAETLAACSKTIRPVWCKP